MLTGVPFLAQSHVRRFLIISGILDLARMIMEGMTPRSSTFENPLTTDEWKLRDLILRLHATTVQIRSFRGRVALDARPEQAADYRAGRESRVQIRSNTRFAKLLPEAQEKLPQR